MSDRDHIRRVTWVAEYTTPRSGLPWTNFIREEFETEEAAREHCKQLDSCHEYHGASSRVWKEIRLA